MTLAKPDLQTRFAEWINSDFKRVDAVLNKARFHLNIYGLLRAKPRIKNQYFGIRKDNIRLG